MTTKEIPGYSITSELKLRSFFTTHYMYTLTVVPLNNTRFLYLNFVYCCARFVNVTVRFSSGEEVVCKHLDHLPLTKIFKDLFWKINKWSSTVFWATFIFQGAKSCRNCASDTLFVFAFEYNGRIYLIWWMVILQIRKIWKITILQMRENCKWQNYQSANYNYTQTQT